MFWNKVKQFFKKWWALIISLLLSVGSIVLTIFSRKKSNNINVPSTGGSTINTISKEHNKLVDKILQNNKNKIDENEKVVNDIEKRIENNKELKNKLNTINNKELIKNMKSDKDFLSQFKRRKK